MKLTKHEHACVVLEKDGASIVIDPGSFSSGAVLQHRKESGPGCRFEL